MNDASQPVRWRLYRRKAVAELIAWTPEMDMERVSVSAADRDAGSPKPGDMVARNPANHDDKWLVAADYFAANFEPIDGQEESDDEVDMLKLVRT